jgi:hypothetical protein
VDSHPAVLNGFIDRIRKKEKELEENKYLKVTARGDKVVSITKDADDRNIAIVQRENDYVVAVRYDTNDGKWAQGIYDFKDLKSAERYRKEHYGKEITQENKWVEVNVSRDALIKKHPKSSFMRMPTSDKEYKGYTYSIYNNRIKESTQLVDMQSDSRELSYCLTLNANELVLLSNREGDEVELTAQEFRDLVNGTTDKDYFRKSADVNRIKVSLPQEAIFKTYDKTSLLTMPTSSKYKGYSYYLPNSVIHEDTQNEDGSLYASLSEDFIVTLKKGEEEIKLTAKEYAEFLNGADKTQYKRVATAMDDYREQQNEDVKKWNSIAISDNAMIAAYTNASLFKMPKGDYEGCVYYVPNGMVRHDENGTSLRLPEDFKANLKNQNGETIELSAQMLIEQLKDKTDDDYESVFRKPSEEQVLQFEKVENRLRATVPEEMKVKPNWVVVRTRENKDTGRLDKFLINVHNGKFAESDNPETWTDFDTACEFAKKNGGIALAYALDGKDKIACIDLDGCIDENGNYSDTAKEVLDKCGKTYIEKSVSGKGLHIFGKTNGMDLRAFSKDGDMEFYQSGHFIAMTGDGAEDVKLQNFDTPEMKSLLERKLDKRSEWHGSGVGIEGLSSMDDREMLEKAFKAKNGDMVKRLYGGEDIKHNHSNSDMSLMNYLAFWSNHDMDQMLRVFATSGLYRPEKPQSYYEYTAIKAVKGTPVYTPPKINNTAIKSTNDGNGKA